MVARSFRLAEILVRIRFPHPYPQGKIMKGSVLTGSTAITSSSFSSVIDAVTAQVSVSTVVEVLAYAVPVVIGLVFMWWGVRKVVRMVMSAFRKGRISV